MKYRTLGSTGYEVSEIGFGAWAIGADSGSVDDTTAMAALHAAVDAGVNFIDTADVYGDDRSFSRRSTVSRGREESGTTASASNGSRRR